MLAGDIGGDIGGGVVEVGQREEEDEVDGHGGEGVDRAPGEAVPARDHARAQLEAVVGPVVLAAVGRAEVNYYVEEEEEVDDHLELPRAALGGLHAEAHAHGHDEHRVDDEHGHDAVPRHLGRLRRVEEPPLLALLALAQPRLG